MTSRSRLPFALPFVALVSLCGCGAGPTAPTGDSADEPTTTSAPSAADPGAPLSEHPRLVYETVVTMNPDGTRTIQTQQVPEGPHKQPPAGNGGVTLEIYRDTGCATADLWLYDFGNETGNRVCFYGQGSMSLSGINFAPGEAVIGNIRSIYAGDSAGQLYEQCGRFVCDFNFSAWEAANSCPNGSPCCDAICQGATGVSLSSN